MKTTKDLLSELAHLVDESNAKGFEAYKPHKTEKKYYSVRNESNEELTQALDILEDLETEDEIADFLESLDEETFSEINEMLSEDQVDEGAILDIEAKIREHDKKRRPDMAAHEIVTHEKIRKNLMTQRTRAQRAYNKKINNESTLERAIANYRSKTRLDEGDVSENAKWRQGYSASGHPAGFKHKNGEVER